MRSGQDMVRCLLAVVAVSVLVPAEALADQCAYVTAAQSGRAIEALEVGQRYLHFCEPCGERAPGPVSTIEAVSSSKVDGYREVSIDGRPIDLAYVFVETQTGRFENLAELARCDADGVSPFIVVDVPIEAPSEPSEACPAPTLAEPPPPLPRPHVVVQMPHQTPQPEGGWPTWFAFTLGGILLAPAWAALWFALWFARRRTSVA